MKYHRVGDDGVTSLMLKTPNDVVYVSEKGLYEILEVRCFHVLCYTG